MFVKILILDINFKGTHFGRSDKFLMKIKMYEKK